MSKIDHTDDAVNHAVADGDQAIHGTKRDTIDQLLKEVIHLLAFSRLRSPTFDLPGRVGRLMLRIRANIPRGLCSTTTTLKELRQVPELVNPPTARESRPCHGLVDWAVAARSATFPSRRAGRSPTMLMRDPRDEPMTSAKRRPSSAYEAALADVLGYRRRPGRQDRGGRSRTDPGLVHGPSPARPRLSVSPCSRASAAKVAASLATAQALITGHATERERLHLAAAQAGPPATDRRQHRVRYRPGQAPRDLRR